MKRQSQTRLLEHLKSASDSETRFALALDLLAVTQSRQMVDEALYALDHVPLDESMRPLLREKAWFYFDHPDKDSGGLLREKLVQLLTRIGHPDDVDLYRAATWVYEQKPVIDVAQTCRAAGLVGLATADHALACLHATRVLGEADTAVLSGEPSLTAVNVLARFEAHLPVYAFVLRQGEDFTRRGIGEVVGQAFEALGAEFPVTEFAALAGPFLALDAPAVSAGIINFIVARKDEALFPLLSRILDETRDDDLLYFGLMALAASRDDGLTMLLYDRAGHCSRGDVRLYIEAVELTAHRDREEMLDALEKRL